MIKQLSDTCTCFFLRGRWLRQGDERLVRKIFSCLNSPNMNIPRMLNVILTFKFKRKTDRNPSIYRDSGFLASDNNFIGYLSWPRNFWLGVKGDSFWKVTILTLKAAQEVILIISLHEQVWLLFLVIMNIAMKASICFSTLVKEFHTRTNLLLRKKHTYSGLKMDSRKKGQEYPHVSKVISKMAISL